MHENYATITRQKDGKAPEFRLNFKSQWSVYVPLGLTFANSGLNKNLRSAHTAVFMCFVWISEQTAIISLYSINWLVFVTETESVYCAVRTGFLNIMQVIPGFKS